MKVVVICALVGLFAANALHAQPSTTRLGLGLAKPYSSTSLGLDGEWLSGSEAWRVTTFASLGAPSDGLERPWLAESLVSRRVAEFGSAQVLVTSGLRLSRPPSGVEEVAFPLLLGARVPIHSRDRWTLSIEGQIGLAYRMAGESDVVARSNRIGLTLDLDRLRLAVGHDDAAGSNSPFLYGGAARVSVGWRIR